MHFELMATAYFQQLDLLLFIQLTYWNVLASPPTDSDCKNGHSMAGKAAWLAFKMAWRLAMCEYDVMSCNTNSMAMACGLVKRH